MDGRATLRAEGRSAGCRLALCRRLRYRRRLRMGRLESRYLRGGRLGNWRCGRDGLCGRHGSRARGRQLGGRAPAQHALDVCGIAGDDDAQHYRLKRNALNELDDEAENRAHDERDEKRDDSVRQARKYNRQEEEGSEDGAEEVERLQDLVDDELVKAEERTPSAAVLEAEALLISIVYVLAVPRDGQNNRCDECDDE